MNETSIALLVLVLVTGVAVSVFLNGWKGLFFICAVLGMAAVTTIAGRLLGYGFEAAVSCGILIAVACWSYLGSRKKAQRKAKKVR